MIENIEVILKNSNQTNTYENSTGTSINGNNRNQNPLHQGLLSDEII
ncbi:hypothetical protein AAAA73_11590 [Bdellovibrio sp. GT3]